MENYKSIIFCHIIAGVNTIVYEPKHLLLASEMNTYSISNSIQSGSWGGFSLKKTRTLTYDSISVKIGNVNSKFSNPQFPDSAFIETDNTIYTNWNIVPSETENGKLYIVSDLTRINNCLSFSKVVTQDQSSGIFIENYIPFLSPREKAMTFEIEYYPTSSNNTYLIFTTPDKNQPNRKFYLKLEGTSVLLWTFIEDGSIWGFGKAY